MSTSGPVLAADAPMFCRDLVVAPVLDMLSALTELPLVEDPDARDALITTVSAGADALREAAASAPAALGRAEVRAADAVEVLVEEVAATATGSPETLESVLAALDGLDEHAHESCGL